MRLKRWRVAPGPGHLDMTPYSWQGRPLSSGEVNATPVALTPNNYAVLAGSADGALFGNLNDPPATADPLLPVRAPLPTVQINYTVWKPGDGTFGNTPYNLYRDMLYNALTPLLAAHNIWCRVEWRVKDRDYPATKALPFHASTEVEHEVTIFPIGEPEGMEVSYTLRHGTLDPARWTGRQALQLWLVGCSEECGPFEPAFGVRTDWEEYLGPAVPGDPIGPTDPGGQPAYAAYYDRVSGFTTVDNSWAAGISAATAAAALFGGGVFEKGRLDIAWGRVTPTIEIPDFDVEWFWTYWDGSWWVTEVFQTDHYDQSAARASWEEAWETVFGRTKAACIAVAAAGGGTLTDLGEDPTSQELADWTVARVRAFFGI